MDERPVIPSFVAKDAALPPSAIAKTTNQEPPNVPRSSIGSIVTNDESTLELQHQRSHSSHESHIQAPPSSKSIEDGSSHQPAVRLKTACSNCRQQKIKCRTTDELATPCERCERMKLNCLYEPRHSRARPRSDSDAANDTPKRRLVARADGENGFTTTFTSVNASTAAPHEKDVITNGEPSPVLPRQPFAREASNATTVRLPYNGASERRQSEAGLAVLNRTVSHESASSYRSPSQTLPRSIDGLRFNAKLIDTLFARFFKHYHSFFPLLDPYQSPNDCFMQSSFLFWVVIAVGSRRWPEDTRLLSSLRSKVLSRAGKLVFLPTVGISSISALLLLVQWSLPEMQSFDDMPYVFSGALLHATMRCGFHMPYTEADKRKYELYSHALLLHQRSAACTGNHCGAGPGIDMQSRRFLDSSSLRYQGDLTSSLTEAIQALANKDLVSPDNVNNHAIQGSLSDYSASLNSYNSRAPTHLDRLYFTISLLMLRALHFLEAPCTNHSTWRFPFDAACELIHTLHDLEKAMHIDLYGTSFVYHGVLLAACTLLRCLKTPFADAIGRDASTAQALFFSSLNMIRNISLVDGDRAAKSAWALQQLWRSDKIYKHPDGMWDLTLHVRNRLSSSVIFDTMWWCRSEFADQPNAYPFVSAPSGVASTFAGDNDGFDPDARVEVIFPPDWIASEYDRKA